MTTVGLKDAKKQTTHVGRPARSGGQFVVHFASRAELPLAATGVVTCGHPVQPPWRWLCIPFFVRYLPLVQIELSRAVSSPALSKSRCIAVSSPHCRSGRNFFSFWE